MPEDSTGESHEAEKVPSNRSSSGSGLGQELKNSRNRWTLGILRDDQTDEVPGSVLLMSKDHKHNAPLGMQSAPRRSSASSLPSPYPQELQSEAMFSRVSSVPEKKLTANGKIILDPQPEDSANDPLNWSAIRRDAALLSLGLYCMVGGGMTPILAAGFTNVAKTYNVSVPRVALTTGLYMMGLGVGSVIVSPTAIAFGKRPVYLATSIIFILTSVWCALSPDYGSLVTARVFQGMAVSPVECLPSASIAEIFFLHERAYRLGIYTLLLLGGKNLVPLVSAAIIQSLGWRWVFWMVAIIVGFCGSLLFFFVPETFWDRTPMPRKHHEHHIVRPSLAGLRKWSSHHERERLKKTQSGQSNDLDPEKLSTENTREDYNIAKHSSAGKRPSRHAHFLSPEDQNQTEKDEVSPHLPRPIDTALVPPESPQGQNLEANLSPITSNPAVLHPYTARNRDAPPKTFLSTLKPYAGRINHENWFKVALRPFILYAYPSILWSSAVYSLSVGWLIVLSESATTIYRAKDTYNFTALQTGLVYISPFIGGILGTAVAGKVSDFIVRAMAKRNGGIYEPEFRLIMAIPVAICTTLGLMGYGWSAQERDNFWVPTIFFGIISFGCTLGSTTAITFAVDSYRQYAGEALVTMNFSKNIFHGLVFSLFFNKWLDSEGSKDVFVALGGIQMAFLLATIPMYIYGKRARMWTVRRNLMEKF